MNRILVISVHPDDEVLGCGGTLLRHKEAGDEINWCIVTAMSESAGYSTEQTATRNSQIAAVDEAFGFKQLTELGLPPAGLYSLKMEQIIKPLSNIFFDLKPDTLYLPFQWDIHSDHRVVFNAAWSCAKTFRTPFIKKILMMETLSETEMAVPVSSQFFVPNLFVDISRFITEKIRLMNIYAGEIKPHPFPRSEENIKALARYRGGTAGYDFAESFMLLRETW